MSNVHNNSNNTRTQSKSNSCSYSFVFFFPKKKISAFGRLIHSISTKMTLYVTKVHSVQHILPILTDMRFKYMISCCLQIIRWFWSFTLILSNRFVALSRAKMILYPFHCFLFVSQRSILIRVQSVIVKNFSNGLIVPRIKFQNGVHGNQAFRF